MRRFFPGAFLTYGQKQTIFGFFQHKYNRRQDAGDFGSVCLKVREKLTVVT